MKGVVVSVVIILLVSGAGLFVQAETNRLVEECIVLLEACEAACGGEKYALAAVCAAEFESLWNSKKLLVEMTSKRDNYEEIANIAARLGPLSKEQDYGEFRADCRSAIQYLRLLQQHETLTWGAVF